MDSRNRHGVDTVCEPRLAGQESRRRRQRSRRVLRRALAPEDLVPNARSALERDMTQATTPAALVSQTIAVEHITISSQRPFAEVQRRLEATLPKLDASIAAALRGGDQKRRTEYDDSGPKLSIFEVRDHGDLLQIFGGRRHALQYEIGNPLTASKMTRYRLAAALYAPL